MSWPRMGSTVLDRYVLNAQIGIGGTSEVYSALDPTTNRIVAVKLLSPAFAHDIRATEMARREAWAIAQLRHPTIPSLYDHGETRLQEGTIVPCTVMELITGSMLTDQLSHGPLPWPRTTKIAATIADAVAVAHRKGIVHRDLTSGNVMLTEASVKIIDFGLAGMARKKRQEAGRLVFRSASRISAPARFPIPSYSPTLLSDESPCDPAEDIFSLGILIYQMLTGRSPYSDLEIDDHSAAARQRRSAPTPVLSIPGMPRALADICRQCMSRHSSNRPDGVTVSLALWSLLV